MKPQLHLTIDWRRHLIKEHDFFVQQMRDRILAQFSNIEAEAEKFAEDQYERVVTSPASEYDYRDMADVAETANEKAIEFYSLLDDLRKQATLSAIAGMYHQWEKELRKFLELEMRHYFKAEAVMKYVWVRDVGNLFDILKEFGWDCTALAFFPKLDACRLVVNVYKHGKGRSLNELNQKFPEYLNNPMRAFKFFDGHLDHEWLEASDGQASEFATAIREFWATFPELLYWQRP
ncbi:hypothetical protein ABIF86_007152 [Bradyrhizobium japonicum]